MKKIVAILLITAMVLCSCGKAEESTAPSAGETQNTEGTETVDNGDGATESTENTDTTEPSEDTTESGEAPTEPIDTPEPDPYAEIKYYPFPLLDMTVAEIEAEYGELEYKPYDMHGYTIEYYLPTLNLYLQFDREDFRTDTLTDPEEAYSFYYDIETLNEDVIPIGIYVIEGSVYPGLTIGTSANEIECVELITSEGFSLIARNSYGTAFQISTDEINEEYYCAVGFKLPDEYAHVTPNLVNPVSDDGKWVTEQFEAFQNGDSVLPLDYVFFVKAGVNML